MADVTDWLAEELERVRGQLDAIDEAREVAYRLQREVTRAAASTIRAIHRREFEAAAEQLARTAELVRTMNNAARPVGLVYYSGFVLDAQKEYAEAATLLALVAERTPPSVVTLEIEPAPYANGLAEAATELRRFVLDALRDGRFDEAERLVDAFEVIYELLVTFDHPEAVSLGLKRRLDTVRASLERTQSDLLATLRESRLQDALLRVERRLPETQDNP